MAKKSKPPYTTTGDIDMFFSGIVNKADPGTVTKKWVSDYNLAANQPEAILGMLRWLGVIDDTHKSTGIWNEVRLPTTRQAKLEELIRASYSGVFERIDVSTATREELKATFVQAYESGDANKPVTCFTALCRLAGIPVAVAGRASGTASTDKGSSPKTTATAVKKTSPKQKQQPLKPKTGRDQVQGDGSLTIVLNVEIPAEWSEDQIRQRLATVRAAVEPRDAT